MWHVALSTMWAVTRDEPFAEFFPTARELGFSHQELNHQVTAAMMKTVDCKALRVRSVHEPCPCDISRADKKARGIHIASLDESPRGLAVDLIRQSIALAHRIGASAVGGENGLDNDVEGVTIYYARDGGGYIIASSQGNDTFAVYDRLPPHAYVKTFDVDGAKDSDGVEVTNVDLGPAFPYGLFACHTDGKPAISLVIAYEDLGLEIDTSYDPRTGLYGSEK